MAAFSCQQYQPCLPDPLLMLNSAFKVSEKDHNTPKNAGSTTLDSPFYPSDDLLMPDGNSTNLDDYPKVESFDQGLLEANNGIISDDNETSFGKKHSTTESSSAVVDNNKLENGEQVSQGGRPITKKRNKRNGSSLTSSLCKDGREGKNKKQKKRKEEDKKQRKAQRKEEKKKTEESPKGYIHVRARRGQATDSHSLAERVRREKISERMKILQKIVPGCDKVTGKALVLDEIINYVQSLQNQVEFLSMKLASLSPVFYDFGAELDAFVVKPEGLVGLGPSSLQDVQQMGPTTSFTDAATTSHYPPQLDDSPLLIPPQDNWSLLREVEDQRHKFHDVSGFTNNLCSFH